MQNIDFENLIIASGNHYPFVYRDADGIHVGDCDNNDTFQSVPDALAFASRARLSGGALSRARAAATNDPNGSTAAEYHWHQDAGLQIDALKRISA